MKSRINREAREISISELWWYVISKWKWLVIGMVVGALLFGAYGAYSAYRANEAAKANVPKEYTMEDLTGEEQEEVKDLVEDYKLYKDVLAKHKENYLMNLDYNDITYCHVTYYIDTDYTYSYLNVEENYASTLCSVYKIFLYSDEMYDKIMQLEIEGLEEIDLVHICNVANEANLIKIGVCADEEWSKVIADTICEALESYYTVATEMVGEHKLIKISSDDRIANAESIRNGQNYKASMVNTIWSEIEETKALFNERQSLVYEKEISKIDELDGDKKELEVTEISYNNLIDKKYILIGVLGGIIVGVVFFVMRYLTGTKIRSIREIGQVYNFEILGKVVRDDLSNKKAMKKLNKIITTKSENTQKIYVAETIINKCKKEELIEVVICSSVEGILDRITEIISSIEKAGISCKLVDNICYDSKALNAVVECKNVIIIEILNVTNREEMEAQIEVCDKFSINILGIVAII